MSRRVPPVGNMTILEAFFVPGRTDDLDPPSAPGVSGAAGKPLTTEVCGQSECRAGDAMHVGRGVDNTGSSRASSSIRSRRARKMSCSKALSRCSAIYDVVVEWCGRPRLACRYGRRARCSSSRA